MEQLLDSLNRALALFAGDWRYDDVRLPNETDVAVMELVDRFIQASADEREQLVAAVPKEYSGHFMSFAVRMATLSVRERSKARVLQGLIALVIENFRIDRREDLMTLAPLHDAAVRVGAEPISLFDQAASVATPVVAQEIKAFARRHPDLKDIKVMGFSAHDAPQGFSYVFRWPELPPDRKT